MAGKILGLVKLGCLLELCLPSALVERPSLTLFLDSQEEVYSVSADMPEQVFLDEYLLDQYQGLSQLKHIFTFFTLSTHYTVVHLIRRKYSK